jgi:hypothetical protein
VSGVGRGSGVGWRVDLAGGRAGTMTMPPEVSAGSRLASSGVIQQLTLTRAMSAWMPVRRDAVHPRRHTDSLCDLGVHPRRHTDSLCDLGVRQTHTVSDICKEWSGWS